MVEFLVDGFVCQVQFTSLTGPPAGFDTRRLSYTSFRLLFAQGMGSRLAAQETKKRGSKSARRSRPSCRLVRPVTARQRPGGQLCSTSRSIAQCGKGNGKSGLMRGEDESSKD